MTAFQLDFTVSTALFDVKFWCLASATTIVLTLLFSDLHESIVDEIGRNQGDETAEREKVRAPAGASLLVKDTRA